MNRLFRYAASAAALMALSQPALAQGTNCIDRADVADMTTYAMPLFMDALQATCADTLPADSFVLNEGDAFAEQFEPLRDSAWPGARRVLVAFIENQTGATREMAEGQNAAMGGVIMNLMQMKGDELRPFVDAMATQLIAEKLKPSNCGDVEAILPLLAPLPPENYGMLISTIFGMVIEEDNDMPICAAE
tara:strand:+ start:1127 stop:1696 length:570 start_codon:yes stop_codon:yes gene_type:complete